MYYLVDLLDNSECTPRTLHLAYDGSPGGSRLCRFALERYRWESLNDTLVYTIENYIAVAKDRPDFWEDHMRLCAVVPRKAPDDSDILAVHKYHFYQNSGFEMDN